MIRGRRVSMVVLALSISMIGGAGCSGASDPAGGPDAGTPDADPSGCPVRTAPPGQPEGPIAAAETFVGDIYLEDEADLAMLDGIRMVQGSVYVPDGHIDDIRDVVLPDVEVITGDLRTLSNYGPIRSMTVPKLETIGGGLWMSWQSNGIERRPFEHVTAPRLDSIGARSLLYTRTMDLACLRSTDLEVLQMSEPPALPRLEQGIFVLADHSIVEVLELPRFTGAVWVAFLDQLTTIHAPNATELHAGDTPLLSTIDVSDTQVAVELVGPMALSGLGFLGGAEVTSLILHGIDGVDDAALQAVVLADHLQELTLGEVDLHALDLDGPTVVDRLSLKALPALTTASLGTVTSVGTLYVDGNDALADLTAPALTTVTGVAPIEPTVVFSYNPVLPYADLQAIVDAVTPNSPGLVTVITCNLGGPCPL